MRMWFLVGGLLTFGGCGLLFADCTLILIPSVRVTVTDAVTGQKICDPQVRATGSGFSGRPLERDGWDPDDPCPEFTILTSGRGLIVLESAAEGYEPGWTVVVVPETEDGCHPVTQHAELQLTPKA